MKPNTQFRIETLEELEEVYKMYTYRMSYALEQEKEDFKKLEKCRYIICDDYGLIYLMEKQEGIEVIPSPLKSTNKPSQYNIGIDTFERMEANCNLDECLAFAKGNIDKYTWRKKNQDKQDFEKIINYAKWALKMIDKK